MSILHTSNQADNTQKHAGSDQLTQQAFSHRASQCHKAMAKDEPAVAIALGGVAEQDTAWHKADS